MYCAIIDNYIIKACLLIISKPTFVVAFCEFWVYSHIFLTLQFFLLLMENLTHHWLHFVLQIVFQSNDIYVHCIIKKSFNNENYWKEWTVSLLHTPVWQSNKISTNSFTLPWASTKYCNLKKTAPFSVSFASAAWQLTQQAVTCMLAQLIYFSKWGYICS